MSSALVSRTYRVALFRSFFAGLVTLDAAVQEPLERRYGRLAGGVGVCVIRRCEVVLVRQEFQHRGFRLVQGYGDASAAVYAAG